MTIYIFTGPTLSAEDGRVELDAVFLPPAAQGDVYRVSLEKPAAIGIIDGYFERVPAVWHKEILWAMAQGIRVYGAASMGALRAAEVAAFGMIGVGAIFKAYLTGEIEDDDEVAVAHEPAERGYRAVSEAMVNVRATVRRAASAGVLREPTADALTQIAKGLFYPERSYPAIVAAGLERGLPADEMAAFRGFYPRGAVNLKREDALAMLRVMKAHLAFAKPMSVRYHFEHTDAWEAARRRAARRAPVTRAPATGTGDAAGGEALIEELRVAGTLPAARRGAIARFLAIEEARRQGRAVDGAGLRAAVEEVRRERGLLAPDDFLRWVKEQHVGDVERFFADESHVRWVETVLAPDVTRALPDHLRSTGEYGPLLARALDKERRLGPSGGASDLPDAGVTETELLRWYFEERLHRPVPSDVAAYALAAGFHDEAALRRALARELAYVVTLEPVRTAP